ncbi:MAG: anacyclamide/piricyclamide family prenylated cyclic peptide, partial [Dolichospermum sp.]
QSGQVTPLNTRGVRAPIPFAGDDAE